MTGTVPGLPAAAGLCWEVPQLSEEEEAGDKTLPWVNARASAWRSSGRAYLHPLAELESEQGGYCYKSGASGWTWEIFGLLSGWWQQGLHYGNCLREEADGGAPGTVFAVGDTSFWGTRGRERETATCHLVPTGGRGSPGELSAPVLRTKLRRN